jgi:hypothetical protein
MTVPRTALLAVALLLGGAVQAQPVDPADLVRAVREATERLDYATAEARAREALARYEAFSPDQLVEVHTTLGVVLHARNDDVEARRQFEAALSLDPTHTLDPVLVSPKTVELFETVRADLARSAPGTAAPVLRYVVVPDLRVGAALRSAALPGWGQFHKGDRARGWAFAVGVGTAAVATRYRDSTSTSAEIEAAYPAYNRRYRVRNALALGTALAWAASVVEALATGGPRAPAAGQIVPAAAGAGLGLRVRF